MKKPPTPEQLAQAVENWNTNHPIGTRVRRYALIEPRSEPTGDHLTRSLAWIMGGHSPVVLLEGFSGCVHLESLEVLPAEQSNIPPVEECKPAPKPKRAAAFFVSDIHNAADALMQAADDHQDPRMFLHHVIARVQELSLEKQES